MKIVLTKKEFFAAIDAQKSTQATQLAIVKAFCDSEIVDFLSEKFNNDISYLALGEHVLATGVVLNVYEDVVALDIDEALTVATLEYLANQEGTFCDFVIAVSPAVKFFTIKFNSNVSAFRNKLAKLLA